MERCFHVSPDLTMPTCVALGIALIGVLIAVDAGRVRRSPAAARECVCDVFGSVGTVRDGEACTIAGTVSRMHASGRVRTAAGGIDFTGAAVTAQAQHSSDRVSFLHTRAVLHGGCELDMLWAPTSDGTAGLAHARLLVGEGCRGLARDAQGTYETSSGFAPVWFDGLHVETRLLAACEPNATLRFPSRDIPLRRADGTTLTMNLGDLTFRGTLISVGNPDLAGGAHECGSLARDDGSGWCVPVAR